MTQQIALALRVVSGLSVKEIARAFLASEGAMEQRITRAKRRVEDAAIAFETPGPVERSERLATVAAMIYLLFNEGDSASGGEAHVRAPLCDEAIRLSRLLLRLFQSEPEIMGLTALLLLQHARTPARLDANGSDHPAGRSGSEPLGTQYDRRRLALIDKLCARRGPDQIRGKRRPRRDAKAAQPGNTMIKLICSMHLSAAGAVPRGHVNRAVAAAKVRGPAAALDMIEPLAAKLPGYISFFGVKGGLALQLGRTEEARVAFDGPSRSPKRLLKPLTSGCT